jgi:hypothetical protein
VAMPVYAFCDTMVDGENYAGSLDRKYNRGYEKVLTLDQFAAEYAAQNNFGPFSTFLPQFERSGAIKREEWNEVGYQPAEYILGLIFLHNSNCWYTAYIAYQPTARLYSAFYTNGLDTSYRFVGYWKQKAVDLPEDLKASFYVAPDGSQAFMVVMNVTDEDRTLDLGVNPGAIGLAPTLSGAKVLYPSGEIAREGNVLEGVTVPAKNFRLILLK